MSQVQHGTLGLGVLDPHQTHTWLLIDISAGDVWHFWVDNTTIFYSGTSVKVLSVDTMRQGSSHRVLIRVFNSTAWPYKTASYALRWSRVFD